MKILLSGSFIALVTALMVTLAFGCGDIEGETGSQSAELNKGQCNAIVATALRSAQRCARGQCGVDECTDVGGAFGEFFFVNRECAGFFETGDVNGLPGNASIHPQTGEAKHIADVICSAVVTCELCAGAPDDVCTEACAEAEE